MDLRYSISYLNTHTGGGFSFFGFRRRQRKQKCAKCGVNEAIINMVNNDDPDDNIDLCVVCYNQYPAEQLLRGNKKEEEIF